MTGDRRLFELWHYDSQRCRMTPHNGQTPFVVEIYDRETVLNRMTFEHHHEAATYAVEQLRAAISTGPTDPSAL